MRSKFFWILLFFVPLIVFACRDDDSNGASDGDLTHIPFDPQTYKLEIPEGWPQMDIPEDNPLTYEGVQLGRRLFFDPILSVDNSISCATCHIPEKGFSDNLPIAVGVGGAVGRRKTMSLINVGFNNNGLFWDGRVQTLEEQSLHPIVDPLEMNSTLEEAERTLREHDEYPARFRKAFGINNKEEISSDLLAKALAQFQRIIIAGGNSIFSRAMRGEIAFTDAQWNGFEMFFDANLLTLDAECAHCHLSPLFTINEYLNNGITQVERLMDHPDPGRGAVTGRLSDYGKFRTTTLFNWELRNHFMHDGRFKTMDDVLDHYDSGGHRPANPDEDNVDLLIYPLNMTELQRYELMEFLKTLTDTTFLSNPDLQNPFDGE